MKKQMLVLGLFAGSLIAADTTTETPKVNGSSLVQMKADGTKIIQDPDGSSVQINPDGSKLIKKPDGTSVLVKPDGTKLIKKADGSTIEVKPGS